MKFEHPFLATCIGSFPHRDEAKVFDLISKNFQEIPFWPQFPNRTFKEGMVAQYSEGFPSIRIDEREQRIWVETSRGFENDVEAFYQWIEKEETEPFQVTEGFAAGLSFLKGLALRLDKEKVKFVKGQVTGPITFGLGLSDQEKKPIFYDSTLRDILVKHLASKARWMEKRFNHLLPGTPTIIFFDEPSLSSFGSAFSSLSREDVIGSLNECFDGVKGLKGVHCCGNTDWSLLLSTRLDLLSFDAYGFFENLSLYPRELGTFLERGGILAWGIVPTNEDGLQKEEAQSLVNRFKEGVDTLSRKGLDPALLTRAIITPSCGTASLPIPLAERACHLTAEVSRRLRDSWPVS